MPGTSERPGRLVAKFTPDEEVRRGLTPEPTTFGRMTGQAPEPQPWRPGDPIVIDLGFAGMGRSFLAAAFAAMGLVLISRALMDSIADGLAAERIFFAVLGLVALGVSVLIWVRRRTPGPNRVILELDGICWQDHEGGSYEMPWTDLSGVSVSTARTRRKFHLGLSQARAVRARIDLLPYDPAPGSRHPELAAFWQDGEPGYYRIELEGVGAKLTRLEEGLRLYAGPRYRGSTDESTAGTPPHA